MRSALALMIAAAVVLGAPSQALGDDTAVGGVAGALQPLASTDIRMKSEAVQAICYNGYAACRAEFLFQNDGEEQTVRLGFPFLLELVPGTLETEVPGVTGFGAWVDDERVPITFDTGTYGGDMVGYYVHEVTFPPGETLVRVEYLVSEGADTGSAPADITPPSAYRDMYSFHGWFDYWLHTGAGWAGTIDAATIRFTLAPDFNRWGIYEAASEYQVSYDGLDGLVSFSQPARDVYEWRFSEFEPTDASDIRLLYYVPTFQSVDGEAMPGSPVTDVTATSVLEDEGAHYAWQAAVAPGAWAEGVPGPGIGERIRIAFGSTRAVTEVRILPGYAETPGMFERFNRPKRVRAIFSDGTSTEITLADTATLQRFPVRATASWGELEILEVYPGTAGDDTYISLVDFGLTSPIFVDYDALVPGEGEPDAEEPASPGLWPWAVAAAALVFAVMVFRAGRRER